jgi:hypothetical protein
MAKISKLKMKASKSRSKKAVKKARPKQVFNVSHADSSAFEQGLRSYAKYRDLGMAKATGGLLQAHVIKMIPPCDPKVVSKRHFHDVDVQMIYVLKGWIRSEFEGREHTFRQGSAWLQPPRIRHTVLDYSADCEMLEIILPAEFETVEL